MSKKTVIIGLIFSLIFMGSAPAYGAQAPSQKDEVVYADLSQDGEARDIYVVNIFEKQGNILDYGNYQKVRNMTSSDKIQQQGDKITINTKTDRLYYQGNVKSGQLPWSINIAYFLDNKKVSPDELTGNSGSLKLQIKIKENKKADKVFFKNYALQVTAPFNTENCRNIKTKDATEANVGGSRQLTWTLMPGTEKTLEVTASVSKFEMDSISFNGIRLDMDVDADSKTLAEQFDQLSAAVKSIDAGAKKLSSGAKKQALGTDQLKKGTALLDKNVKQLDEAAEKTGTLSEASTEINRAMGSLSQGMGQLKEEINYNSYKEAMKQNGLDLDQLKTGNQQMLQVISSLESAYGPAMTPEQKQQITDAKRLLSGNTAAFEGMEKYLSGASETLSAAEQNTKKLKNNYQNFDHGVQELTTKLGDMNTSQIRQLAEGVDSLEAGSGQLKSGSDQLAAGTGKLNSKTSGMGKQVTDRIDELLAGISGDHSIEKSFVSEKNTNVRAVQFVIKNDPVEVQEQETPAQSKEKTLTWWQKLLDLFGLY